MLSRQSMAASASRWCSRSMMTPTDDTVARIKSALQDSNTPPWLPSLTSDLVAAGWHKLECDQGLTRDSYGTARVLGRDPKGARRLVASLVTPHRDESTSNAIQVELLPEDVTQQWANQGFRFFSENEIKIGGAKERVEEAFHLLDRVPTILATVCPLLRSLHMLDTSNDQVDVSFSEPSMPFSIFISTPGPGAENGIVRVAEAILHEAMHLQLTFIEGFVPLVEPSVASYYSPWRDEYRAPIGVLHALYVFRVIDSYFGALLTDGQMSEYLRRHAIKRRAEIAQQIELIRDFREDSSLREAGGNLVSRLLT